MANPTVLITGSNRGLGLGFAKTFAQKGFTVFATARDPKKSAELKDLARKYKGRIVPIKLDVTNDASVQKARAEVEKQTQLLDVLVNNAGINRRFEFHDLPHLKFKPVYDCLDANTLGPLRVTLMFLPLLAKARDPKVAHVTSLMGSISDNTTGGAYAYRISKTALNMLHKNLSIDLKRLGVKSVLLSPGWVKTDMGGKDAPLDIETSVTGMVDVILNLDATRNGAFLRYNGPVCPY